MTSPLAQFKKDCTMPKSRRSKRKLEPPMRWDAFVAEMWRFLPWQKCYEQPWKYRSGHGSEIIWWEEKRHLLLHAFSEHKKGLGERVLGGRLYGQIFNLEISSREEWGTRHVPASLSGVHQLRQSFYEIDFDPEYEFVAWRYIDEPSRKQEPAADMIIGPSDVNTKEHLENKIKSLPDKAREGLMHLARMKMPPPSPTNLTSPISNP